MVWVYTIPAWLFFLSVPIAAALLSGGGLLAFRHFVKQSDELTHNDVAGPIIGTVGTILAVILSFLLVTVWQEYDGSAGNVAREASAVADLYHLAANLPNPVAQRLRATLRLYVDAVVTDEWPAMRGGRSSAVARNAALATLDIVARYQPRSVSQQAIQQSAFGLISTFQDARRDRLFANQQGIPAFFWVGDLLLALVTIGFCYIFRVRSQVAHLVMTVALSTVIATIFVLIALFDYPFRGDTQISPAVFVQLQHALTIGVNESD
ncbi:MAG TPA: DUF4239 domain-containing protein [Candidatus Tumulicola sp.]